AASKKPLPSDLTTSAIFTSAALAAVVMAAKAKATPMASFLASFMFSLLPMLIVLLPWRRSGRRRGILLAGGLSFAPSDNKMHTRLLDHAGSLLRNLVVGNDRGHFLQRAEDQARPP